MDYEDCCGLKLSGMEMNPFKLVSFVSYTKVLCVQT